MSSSGFLIGLYSIYYLYYHLVAVKKKLQKQLEFIHLKKYLKAYSWQDPGDAVLNKMDMVPAFMLIFQLGKACWCCKALSVRQQPHESIAW